MNKLAKTILVTPLEWGLGHTTRLVPVIDSCLNRGMKIIIAADGKPLDFLRNRFPDLPWFVLPFPKVRYSRKNQLLIKLLPQIPAIVKTIKQNRKLISLKVKEFGIDAIIGDHRYGVYQKNIPSVFITNQLWLISPAGLQFGENLLFKFHLWILRKYTFIWLADFPGQNNFTGRQTHLPNQPSKSRFIGPISRFTGKHTDNSPLSEKNDFLVILSGPEPQRSILEDIIINIFHGTSHQIMILRGLPLAGNFHLNQVTENGNIKLMDHADDEQIARYIKSSGKIICRPGLSMLSDLAALGRSALLVPTPGQTEQNYMAARLAGKGYFQVIKQKDLQLTSFEQFNPRQYIRIQEPNLSALNEALDELFDS